MNEKLNEALDQLPDKYIQEAVAPRKRRIPWYFGAIAAVLAVVLLFAVINPPGTVIPPSATPTQPSEHIPSYGSFSRLAIPRYPQMAPYRDFGEPGHEEWVESIDSQYDQPQGYADSLTHFFSEGIPLFLNSAQDKNSVCSPLNIYMALAMLAECTEGNSRQQILTLMGVETIQELRQQAGYVWNAHYRDDGLAKLLMANSLWLDDAYSFQSDTVNLLAEYYYASVFHGDLGTESANQALRDWINEQTGGLLDEQSSDISLDPRTVLALASAIEYRVDWQSKFDKSKNSEALFHGANGDTAATFMHKSIADTYFAGDNFSAMALPLQDGSKMWLILPDEGITPEALLSEGTAVSMTLGTRDGIGFANILINLSLPKFDVSSSASMVNAIKALGITDVFSPELADFSSITDSSLFVTAVDHAARVTVDEEGVIAVGYTVIGAPGAAIPPNEVVDFVLDRPFLFVITSPDGLPLFVGIVNTI